MQDGKKKRVLILCTGNSARSQMAEGLLRHDRGEFFEVYSAGVMPSEVRPEAIQVMKEIGIDISGHRSKSVDEFIGQELDYVVTVCDNAKETCPIFPGKTERIHKSFEDPPAPGAMSEPETLAIFRRVRDEIWEWIKGFNEGNSLRVGVSSKPGAVQEHDCCRHLEYGPSSPATKERRWPRARTRPNPSAD